MGRKARNVEKVENLYRTATAQKIMPALRLTQAESLFSGRFKFPRESRRAGAGNASGTIEGGS